MTVRDVEFISIEGRRFTKRREVVGQVKIDTNSTVTLVTELSPREADVDFRLAISYGSLGVMKIEGRMIFEGDAASLSREWHARHSMPTEMANEIHTSILHSCIPETVLLAKELGLPPPIPLPKVNIQEQKKPSSPSSMEVA
ncbi:MAG: hypothetical protein ACUVV6_06015 [Thermoplasmatota archaeon]